MTYGKTPTQPFQVLICAGRIALQVSKTFIRKLGDEKTVKMNTIQQRRLYDDIVIDVFSIIVSVVYFNLLYWFVLSSLSQILV